MRVRFPWRTVLVAVAVLAASVANASPPDWMRALVNSSLPAYDEETSAVLLYSETVLTVRDYGRVVRLDRKAFKILRDDGADVAIVRLGFSGDSPILSLRGWSIPATGRPSEVRLKDAAESGLTDIAAGQFVTDYKEKLLRLPDARPGSIVGYEVEQQVAPYVLLDEWRLQGPLPVREASYTLRLPAGWTFKSSWMNRAEESPEILGRGEWRWKASNVDAIVREQSMPPWQGIAAQMVVALVPPPGKVVGGFQSWRDMGLWYLDLARDRPKASPAIKAKVQQVASAGSVLEKTRALARYVQSDIRYVGIQLGIGGFQPHAAEAVFSNGYGDCKDKVTLLMSMLKEVGVDAYYVLINSSRGSVTASSPPNLGFDHVILAIQLPANDESAALAAAVTHPKLGRVLFFDPTSPFVPFGRLPGELQAGYGLLVTADGGELMQMPLAPFETNGRKRTAKLSLDAKGTLRGDVEEQWQGDTAADERGRFQYVERDTDRRKTLEERLALSLANFQVDKASVRGSTTLDRPLEWQYTLEAASYSKLVGNVMLLRPRVLGSLSSRMLETPKARRQPIEFVVPSRWVDVFEITLPEGFVVDQLPPAVKEDLGFASYRSGVEAVDAHTLRYSRTFDLREVTVPAAKAEELKKLYRAIDVDERASVVLRNSRVQ